MKYTIEMFCCDSCHARATNNDVMNGILGYKNSADWLFGYSSDYKETYNFCSEKCWKEAVKCDKILP